MKRCPICTRTFDDSLTYCLIDGTVLSAPFNVQEASASGAQGSPTEVLEVSPTQIAESSVVTRFLGSETALQTKPIQNSPGKLSTKNFIAFGGLAIIAIIILLALNLINRQPQQIAVVKTPDPSPTSNTQETLPSQPVKTPFKVDKERALSIMTNFKIGIYYWKKDEDRAQKATSIKERLTEYGFKNITIYPKEESFFGEIGQTYSDEVRYEEGLENEQAESLSNILNELYPGKKFKKQPVSNRTENFISIILGEEPKN